MLCFGGTAGIMAVCGMIGMLSGVDFSGMGTYLMIGLFGMIIFGVVAMFVRMSRTVSIVHAIIGVFLFSTTQPATVAWLRAAAGALVLVAWRRPADRAAAATVFSGSSAGLCSG